MKRLCSSFGDRGFTGSFGEKSAPTSLDPMPLMPPPWPAPATAGRRCCATTDRLAPNTTEAAAIDHHAHRTRALVPVLPALVLFFVFCIDLVVLISGLSL